MYKKILGIYKTPLLLSATLVIVLLAMRVQLNPVQIAGVILGSFMGTFFLDMDYFIYAYFVNPHADFSKTLLAFFQHKDIGNALVYINYHKDDIKDKILNSALFQVVFALFSIFVLASNTDFSLKALVLSIYANSMYRFLECFYKGNSDEWFWAFKSKPKKAEVYVFVAVLVGIFAYCVSIF